MQQEKREKSISRVRINWAPTLRNQYVPTETIRAQTPPEDETGRFTALLGSNSNGFMLPLFLIIKCSCKSLLDLGGSTVLSKFLDPIKN